VALTLVFATSQFDIALARIFYRSEGTDHWPFAVRLPWSVLYRAAPWITASLILAGLAVLIAGFLRREERWRRYGVFVLLAVVIGPGLIINATFKDHWDRPRPRDIVEFGGNAHYVMAPLRGEGGASFPCGHCSVGFLYGLGWWIWRDRRRQWARLSMAAGLLAGTALGLGRMAAGGHFVSDILWSAIIAFAVAHALDYYVLRTPALERESAAPITRPRAAVRHLPMTLLATALGIAVLTALFVTPHGMALHEEIPLTSLSHAPQVFEVTARTADVEILIADMPANTVSISGELHGFGLPTGRLSAESEFVPEPVPTLEYRIVQNGWFTDLSCFLSVRLPTAPFTQIRVRLERGNIRVTDMTQARVVDSGRLHLDLRTARGSVQAKAPGP